MVPLAMFFINIWRQLMVSLIFFTFQIRRVPAAMGFWTRHLPVFVVILLLSETNADKEFWWMGQEGTFGQGSQVG